MLRSLRSIIGRSNATLIWSTPSLSPLCCRLLPLSRYLPSCLHSLMVLCSTVVVVVVVVQPVAAAREAILSSYRAIITDMEQHTHRFFSERVRSLVGPCEVEVLLSALLCSAVLCSVRRHLPVLSQWCSLWSLCCVCCDVCCSVCLSSRRRVQQVPIIGLQLSMAPREAHSSATFAVLMRLDVTNSAH